MFFNQKFILSLGLLLISCIAFAQDAYKTDSLLNIIKNTNEDTSLVRLYIELSNELPRTDTILRQSYADSALETALKTGNEILVAKATKNKAIITRFLRMRDEAIVIYKRALLLFEKLGDTVEIANVNFHLGVMHYLINDYQTSINYHAKALALRKHMKDTVTIIESELGVAAMLWRTGDLNNAEEHYLEAMKISLMTNDSESACTAFNSLGAIYWGLGEFNSALEYYEKALNEAIRIDFKRKYALIVNNIGLIYHEWGDNDKALENYKDGLEAAKAENYNYGTAYSYNNIGEIYYLKSEYKKALVYFDSALANYNKINQKDGIAFSYRKKGNVFAGLKNYDEAIRYYQLSIETAKEIKSEHHEALALSELAQTYYMMKKYDLAKKTARTSLGISLRNDYKNISKDIYFLFSDLYELSGLNKDALYYYKKATFLKDSIFNEKRSQQIADMQARYETEKKERENDLLRKEEQLKNIQLAANQSIIQRQYVVIGAFAVFLLVVVILAFKLNENRKKVIKSTELLKAQNEEINKQKEELFKQQTDLREVNRLLKNKTSDLELNKVELKKKIEELEEVTAFKNKIFSIIGHDLRGPVGTISSIVSLIMEEQLSEDKRKKLLSVTKDNTVATYALLENLLAWANSERGQISYHPEKLDLGKIVSDTVALLKERALEKSIKLVNSVNESIFVFADYNTTGTIIRNLVSNALKYSHKGGEVKIEAEVKNKHIEIAVVDNGVGMEPKKLEQVLDRNNHYTERGTADEKGSGLGLSLCFEFIERNNGKYRILSKEGQGTRFEFTLPKGE